MIIKGRTFIITGGSSGLGLATAKELVGQGANVGILDVTANEEVQTELGRDRAKLLKVDVTDPTGVQTALKSLVEWSRQTQMPLGGLLTAAGIGRIDKLVDKDGEPVPMEYLDAVLNTNIRGVLNVIRLCLPHLIQTEPYGPDGERGIIVMVSSAAARNSGVGQAAYVASKGAVSSLTLELTRELGEHGIRCISIEPGIFGTPILRAFPKQSLPLFNRLSEFPKRPGKPSEFAMLVRHCIENPMLNGDCIKLDAGARFPGKL